MHSALDRVIGYAFRRSKDPMSHRAMHCLVKYDVHYTTYLSSLSTSAFYMAWPGRSRGSLSGAESSIYKLKRRANVYLLGVGPTEHTAATTIAMHCLWTCSN